MSLRINENTIFCITPKSKYELSEDIGKFMEIDFTIFVEAKIYKEALTTEYPSFFFCRNGRHVGLSAILTEKNEIAVNLTYWFVDENKNGIMKEETFILPSEIEDKNNRYTMICNTVSKVIKLYINEEENCKIEYPSLEKDIFTEALIWLGCGSMMSDDPFYKSVGDFEYELLMCLDKVLTIEEITEIRNNYKTNYIEIDTFKGLPILNKAIPNRKNYKVFCDFNNYNRYKLWDMTGNGNYPQLYIENNIHF
jgi:hypothetical protein